MPTAQVRWRHAPVPHGRLLVALGVGSVLASTATAGVAHAAPDAPARTTTSSATAGGEAKRPYSRLRQLPGWRRVVRDDLGAKPVKRRLARRSSLLYFAQLSDVQLADEESPARVAARRRWRAGASTTPTRRRAPSGHGRATRG